MCVTEFVGTWLRLFDAVADQVTLPMAVPDGEVVGDRLREGDTVVVTGCVRVLV